LHARTAKKTPLFNEVIYGLHFNSIQIILKDLKFYQSNLKPFLRIINKVLAEKEVVEIPPDEMNSIMPIGCGPPIRKSSTEEYKYPVSVRFFDLQLYGRPTIFIKHFQSHILKELQLMQTKISELTNFKDATGETVSKLVEAVISKNSNWHKYY